MPSIGYIAVTHIDVFITHRGAQNLQWSLASSQAFANQLLFMASRDHISQCTGFFFQLVLRKIPGKRHQFPSPLPSLTSWSLLASLLLFQQDKLDLFPECVHLLIHLPATLNPQKGYSWLQPHPHLFFRSAQMLASSERFPLSSL